MRLWRDWCRLWPEQYGHNSLQVHAGGYDPVFDVIPSQAYKDFYLEVVRNHPRLQHLNAFEVIDTALNQVRAPETTVVEEAEEVDLSGIAIELEVVRKQKGMAEGETAGPRAQDSSHRATVTPLASARKASRD